MKKASPRSYLVERSKRSPRPHQAGARDVVRSSRWRWRARLFAPIASDSEAVALTCRRGDKQVTRHGRQFWVRHLSTKFALLTPALLLGAFLTLDCGGAPPPAPSPSPIPAPVPGQLPNLQGNWSGTLESSSFSTKTVSALFFQEADCVDATWHSVSSGARWVGAISVFVRLGGSLDGDMSFEVPVSGRLCTGTGTVTGEVTDNTGTVRWTLTSYSTNTCTASDVPSQMILRLQR